MVRTVGAGVGSHRPHLVEVVHIIGEDLVAAAGADLRRVSREAGVGTRSTWSVASLELRNIRPKSSWPTPHSPRDNVGRDPHVPSFKRSCDDTLDPAECR